MLCSVNVNDNEHIFTAKNCIKGANVCVKSKLNIF